MPLAAGLVVHLHVHVNFLFFANCDESCETVFIRKLFIKIRKLLITGIKNVPIFAHFFNDTAQLFK